MSINTVPDASNSMAGQQIAIAGILSRVGLSAASVSLDVHGRIHGALRLPGRWWVEAEELVLATDECVPFARFVATGGSPWTGRCAPQFGGSVVRLTLDCNGNAALRSLMDYLGGEPELLARLRRGDSLQGNGRWWLHPAVCAAHRKLADEAIDGVSPYNTSFFGRGIVICAGGPRLFANAWVCLRMLRYWGCRLPVQLWHLGEVEMDGAMRRLSARLGAECVDAEKVRNAEPARRLAGYELKPYAILNCSFREVILLDADNVPLIDPTSLFETREYEKHGALFWPDYGRMEKYPTIWDACGVENRDEPEFESGQIVVDKERCWQALNLTKHFNDHSDFYYRHMLGDKETFHMAFRRVGKSYAMPTRPIENLENVVMCQHDFQGRRIFQHRNLDKWKLDGSNRRIAGFQHENLCRTFLADLRDRWCGRVHWNDAPTAYESGGIRAAAGRAYWLERPGVQRHGLLLGEDRTIGLGATTDLSSWTVVSHRGEMHLALHGSQELTCLLSKSEDTWVAKQYGRDVTEVVMRPATEDDIIANSSPNNVPRMRRRY